MSGEIDVGIKQHTFELPHHRRATIETGIKADLNINKDKGLPARDQQILEESSDFGTRESYITSEDDA